MEENFEVSMHDLLCKLFSSFSNFKGLMTKELVSIFYQVKSLTRENFLTCFEGFLGIWICIYGLSLSISMIQSFPYF